jgi:hypothetical protein
VTFWRIPIIIKYIKYIIFYDLKNVPFPRHLFSEINQLEKSPWKTGGGVHEAGRKKKFNLDRNVALRMVFVAIRGGEERGFGEGSVACKPHFSHR